MLYRIAQRFNSRKPDWVPRPADAAHLYLKVSAEDYAEAIFAPDSATPEALDTVQRAFVAGAHFEHYRQNGGRNRWAELATYVLAGVVIGAVALSVSRYLTAPAPTQVQLPAYTEYRPACQPDEILIQAGAPPKALCAKRADLRPAQ